MLGTISSTSVANLNSTVIIVIMNSTKEKEIGLGRTWRRRPLGSQEVRSLFSVCSVLCNCV